MTDRTPDGTPHTPLPTDPARDPATGTTPETAATGTTATGTDDTSATRTVTEEFKLSGEAVVGKVKELVREGNVRRIIVANEEGRTLLEIPLTIGVIGTVLLPVWAAIGAVAALAANLTLRVERRVPVDEVEADDVVAGDGHGG